MWRCAEAEERINNLEGAQSHLHDLLKMPLDTDEQRLEALCFLADVQASLLPSNLRYSVLCLQEAPQILYFWNECTSPYAPLPMLSVVYVPWKSNAADNVCKGFVGATELDRVISG